MQLTGTKRLRDGRQMLPAGGYSEPTENQGIMDMETGEIIALSKKDQRIADAKKNRKEVMAKLQAKVDKENAEAAKPKTKTESKSKSGGYTGAQVLKGLEKADRSTSQEAFTKEVDKYRGSVNRAVSHIEDKIAGLYEGKYTALDKIKKLESDLSKANERSARAYGRRAAKLRSVDNPYGLTGDGRDYNKGKTREKIRSLDSEVTQAKSRVNRIDNQIGKLQNQLSRLNEIYGIENPVAVIQRAAGRGYDKKYPD